MGEKNKTVIGEFVVEQGEEKGVLLQTSSIWFHHKVSGGSNGNNTNEGEPGALQAIYF